MNTKSPACKAAQKNIQLSSLVPGMLNLN